MGTSNSSSSYRSSYSSYSSDSIFAVVDKKTTTSVDVPADAVVSDGTTSGVTLTFDSMALTLTFASAEGKWDLSNVTLKYPVDGKQQVVEKSSKDADGILGIHAHLDNAFSCKVEKKIEMSDDVVFTVVGLKVQPYLSSKSDNSYGKAEICEEDKIPNNVVPIAVGAALAALVVLVLIMYLIGRRKHQRG